MMKCEVCGKEIDIIYRVFYSTNAEGLHDGPCPDIATGEKEFEGLRCGCHENDEYAPCPYYLWDGRIRRRIG